MNPTQAVSTFMPIITFIAGVLAGKGIFGIDATTWVTVLSGIVTFVATIFSAFWTRNNGIITAAAALPEVKAVVAPSVANTSLASVDNVVSSATEAQKL